MRTILVFKPQTFFECPKGHSHLCDSDEIFTEDYTDFTFDGLILDVFDEPKIFCQQCNDDKNEDEYFGYPIAELKTLKIEIDKKEVQRYRKKFKKGFYERLRLYIKIIDLEKEREQAEDAIRRRQDK